jgi:hypothetical protein
MRRRRAPLIYRGGGRLWMTRPTHGCFRDRSVGRFSGSQVKKLMKALLRRLKSGRGNPRSLRCAAGDRRLAFLSLSGSLSPVHTQHMRALEAARNALTKGGWTVVAGFLTPVGDKFLKGKLAIEAWPLDKRVRLCEVAAGESDWVDVCSWASSAATGCVPRCERTWSASVLS